MQWYANVLAGVMITHGVACLTGGAPGLGSSLITAGAFIIGFAWEPAR